jgi:3-deoxy-manno-octulosonate cytidylyltransferase (CMP-KDO synthetase)
MSSQLTQWLFVVPARLGSERLPRKPLVDLAGKPLVVRVAENLAPLVKRGAALVVATDSSEVLSVCQTHGVKAVMTRPDHPSGTDRTAEAALPEHRPYVMNVQGDEPFVDPEDLLGLASAMEARADADIGTLVYQSRDAKLAADPNAVKALRRLDGYALYFSRHAVPYDRAANDRRHLPEVFWHHMGVYAFRREKLQEFVKLKPSPLETAEKLEQLRALENGWKIYLQPAKSFARGIDTPEDLEAARARF